MSTITVSMSYSYIQQQAMDIVQIENTTKESLLGALRDINKDITNPVTDEEVQYIAGTIWEEKHND